MGKRAGNQPCACATAAPSLASCCLFHCLHNTALPSVQKLPMLPNKCARQSWILSVICADYANWHSCVLARITRTGITAASSLPPASSEVKKRRPTRGDWQPSALGRRTLSGRGSRGLGDGHPQNLRAASDHCRLQRARPRPSSEGPHLFMHGPSSYNSAQTLARQSGFRPRAPAPGRSEEPRLLSEGLHLLMRGPGSNPTRAPAREFGFKPCASAPGARARARPPDSIRRRT